MEPQQDSIVLHPEPGYVLKTRFLKAPSITPGTKVFINVCHDSQVPKPEQDFDPSVVFQLIMENQWEIPIIVSKEKEVRDKKGNLSYCYDCCINPTCFRWCLVSAELKSILNEWCIEAVELLYSSVLDRQYSIPKMASKGELAEINMRKSELSDSSLHQKLEDIKKHESLGLIEEIKGGDPMDEDTDIFISAVPSKKPLIEVLDDKPKRAPVRDSLEEKPREISYSVNFQKVADPYQVLVKIESNLPVDLIKVALQPEGLVVISKSPRHFFNASTRNSELTIPLSHKPQHTRIFSIDNTLFIFC